MEKVQKNCIFIAYNFVIHPQILMLSVFKIASFLHTDCECLMLQSICHTGNSSQQTSQQCLSTINMVLSDKDKILKKHINTLRIHSYTCREIKIGVLKMQVVCIFFYIC